jgi:hypothetical protein
MMTPQSKPGRFLARAAVLAVAVIVPAYGTTQSTLKVNQPLS